MTEAIPPNASDPRGKSVDLRMWVDSDHAGDNYSDMMTKVLYEQKKRDNVAHILYNIWDHEDGPETTKG